MMSDLKGWNGELSKSGLIGSFLGKWKGRMMCEGRGVRRY